MKFEINNELPDIPDQVEKWAEDNVFGMKGYIYYKKHGRHVECFCAACGATYHGVTEVSPDITGAAEHLIDKPTHGAAAKCEKCGRETTYKAAGLQKRPYYQYSDYEFITKQKDRIVWRTVSITMKLAANQKTEFTHQEFSRLFLKNGEGLRRFDKVYNWYSKGQHWNELKTFHPTKYSGHLYPPSVKILRAHFKYIPVPETKLHCNFKAYYAAAAKYKDFEMVKKLNLTGLEDYMLNSFSHGLNLNLRSKSIEGRLRINKDRLKEVVKNKGDVYLIRALQIEKKSGKRFTQGDIDSCIAMIRALYNGKELSDYEHLLTMYSPERIWNYTEAQIKSSSHYMTRSFYFDYIRMRREAEYDLSNEIYAFPKDLRQKHDELVYMKEKDKRDKRIAEKDKQFKHIAENYKKLEKKYGYAAAGLIIRPAMSAGEIIDEGAFLHHCVGSSDTYMSRHDTGKTFILLLRKSKSPENPYITVELDKEGKVKQWFGKHDTKPNKRKIDKWLNSYCESLKKPKRKVSATA